jgi:sulfate/thiosulfate transport system permease protein
MASIVTRLDRPPAERRPLRATADSPLLKWTLLTVALGFLLFFLLLPLVSVFAEAFRRGADLYFEAFKDSDTAHAIKLTLIVTALTVPLNLVFGVAAAWAISKYTFKGKALLTTFIDLPFAVSPVIAGLIYVLIFSVHGWFPPETQKAVFEPLAIVFTWLAALPGLDGVFGGLAEWFTEPKIIFAIPGIVLATIFVTFPFIARELIPLMQAQGNDEEYAAVTLGANGWQTFWRVTLPNIKWGLFYGVILCNARAMGEFGAVSVVSGKIRGETTTMPLHIEILYNEYAFVASFAVASVLALLALVTLVLKSLVEWRFSKTGAPGH